MKSFTMHQAKKKRKKRKNSYRWKNNGMYDKCTMHHTFYKPF